MKGFTWPGVALVAVLGALALGLLTLTDLRSGEVLGIVGVLAGIGGGAAVAAAATSGVQQQVEALQQETQAQTPVLATVAKRVNGELDARIEAGADRAVAQVIGVLRDEGVIGRRE